ncbi:MAG: hypothetical protein JWM33_3880 [Caulobacteraceae bacterium]|nr:hypothetical protein [Caulobacteraceae bacterium]
MRNLAVLALAAALLAPMSAHAAGDNTPVTTDPDALPGLVTGVVGSGDQMALRLTPVGDAAARDLKIGDEFRNGWRLTALTPSAATLTRDGASQTVGLNPTGALADAPAATGGSTVTVVSHEPTLAEAGDPATRAKVDEAVVGARASYAQAKAAYDAATPENRAALLQAMNGAGTAMVGAENDQILMSEIGAGVTVRLPPLVYRAPGAPPSAAELAVIAEARQSGVIQSAQQP